MLTSFVAACSTSMAKDCVYTYSGELDNLLTSLFNSFGLFAGADPISRSRYGKSPSISCISGTRIRWEIPVVLRKITGFSCICDTRYRVFKIHGHLRRVDTVKVEFALKPSYLEAAPRQAGLGCRRSVQAEVVCRTRASRRRLELGLYLYRLE